MKKWNGKIAGLAYSVSSALPYIFQLIIQLAVTVLLLSFGSDNITGVTGNKYFIWMLLFVNQMAFAAVIYFSAKKAKCNVLVACGVKKRLDLEYAGLGIAVTVALLFFFTPIVAYLSEGLKGLGYHAADNLPPINSWGNFFMSVFLLAILPAVFEEGLFRGVILGGLKQYGKVFAILISTLFFMLMHQNIEQSVYQVALGLALAYIAVKTDSIVIPVIMHFVSNFAVLLMEFLSYLMGTSTSGAVQAWQWVAMAIGGVAIAVIVLYEFVVKRRRQGKDAPPETAAQDMQTEGVEADKAIAYPKKVMAAYASFGVLFNVIMLIVNLVIGFQIQ